ncbi:MAG: hypothetical protein ACI4PE_00875 [Bacilli bacterium]
MEQQTKDTILGILSTNLSKEQKEALLGEIANGIIEKKEDKREELIEKNRQQANEVRQSLKEREKEAYRNEIIKDSDEKVEEYIKELSEVKNSNNEYIYKDLEQEYKNGEISKTEIYDLYERVFNKKQEIYQEVFKGLEEKKGFRKPKSPTGKNKEEDNSDQKIESEQENVDEIEPENVDEIEPEQEIDDEYEIVDERDGSHLTMKEKFKKILKKSAKIGAVIGGVGLIATAIYNSVMTGDVTSVHDVITNTADAIQNAAQTAVDTAPNLNDITTVGDVTEVFSSNQDAILGSPEKTPLDPYFQNEILGYTTADNQMTSASNLGEVMEAYSNGEDITSLYVGNEQGIDGFVNAVDGQSLEDVLSSGGRSR